MSEEKNIPIDLTNNATNSSTNLFPPSVFGSSPGRLQAGSFSAPAPILPGLKTEFVLVAQLSKHALGQLRAMVAEEVKKALGVKDDYKDMRQALVSFHDFLLQDCGEYECDADWRRKRDDLLCVAASLIVSRVE